MLTRPTAKHPHMAACPCCRVAYLDRHFCCLPAALYCLSRATPMPCCLLALCPSAAGILTKLHIHHQHISLDPQCVSLKIAATLRPTTCLPGWQAQCFTCSASRYALSMPCSMPAFQGASREVLLLKYINYLAQSACCTCSGCIPCCFNALQHASLPASQRRGAPAEVQGLPGATNGECGHV